jgi:transcriptional regulator with XRE-family HTH domain
VSDKDLTVGQRIGQARREKGLRERRDIGLRELAEGADVSYESARAWEADEKAPSEKSLEAVADYLGVRVPWLRYGEGEKIAPPSPVGRRRIRPSEDARKREKGA